MKTLLRWLARKNTPMRSTSAVVILADYPRIHDSNRLE